MMRIFLFFIFGHTTISTCESGFVCHKVELRLVILICLIDLWEEELLRAFLLFIFFSKHYYQDLRSRYGRRDEQWHHWQEDISKLVSWEGTILGVERTLWKFWSAWCIHTKYQHLSYLQEKVDRFLHIFIWVIFFCFCD